MARRSRIRKVTILPRNIDKAVTVRPMNSRPPISQQPITPQPKNNLDVKNSYALEIMHKMFIENLHFSQHIPGDIIILGESKENLPAFFSNKKIIFISDVNEINSSKISFMYVNVNLRSYEKTKEIIDRTKNIMSWGSIYFIPSYHGYHGKIRFQVPSKVGDPGSNAWDDFITENYFKTYSSKQRPLLPRFPKDTENHLVIKYFPTPKKIKRKKSRISVITVFRTGGTYTEEHVTHILKSCEAHIKIPFDFYCLTDMKSNFLNRDIKKIPLKHNWPGYWSKMEMFRSDIFENSNDVFYLDLDTLITTDITDIASIDSSFFGMRDFNTLNLLSSAIIKYKPSDNHYIYDTFLQNPAKWMKCRGGDQEAIHKILKVLPEYIQDLYPRRMAEFLNHCWNPNNSHSPVEIKDYHSIVCFHGKPKMEDLLNNPVIKKHSYR